jgi:hypothetical protein
MKNKSTAVLLLLAVVMEFGLIMWEHKIIMKQQTLIRLLYDDAWNRHNPNHQTQHNNGTFEF